MYIKTIFWITLSLFSQLSLAQDRFKTLHIADFEALRKSDKGVVLLDANVESTRRNAGLIQGARALSSYDKFSADELPANKNASLVFYCANTMCTASHVAAERAIELGYKNVSVLADGVYGWKKAGKPTDPYLAPSAKEISPQDAKKLIDQKTASLLDVREGEERHEVISGAQWLPMSETSSQKWDSFVAGLDKSKIIIVHCAAGMRSKKIAAKLAEAGFQAAYFKGPDQWKAAGLPLEKGPAN